MTLRRTPPVPAPRPIEVAQRVVSGTQVSLARLPSLDDLDTHGAWGTQTPHRPAGRNVTAAVCGDPAPGRSALDQRQGERA